MKLHILKLLGGLLLLASWITQNTLQNHWAGRSAKLQQAEVIYLTFLSNSFVMNAMTEKNSSTLYWNAQNFRLGLDYMATALQKTKKDDWREVVSSAKDDDLNIIGLKLMEEVEAEGKRIGTWRAWSWWMFLVAYLAGASSVIVADLLKAHREQPKDA